MQFKTLISTLKEVCSVKEITLKDLLVPGGLPKLSTFSFACDDATAALWGRAFWEQRWSLPPA